MPQGHPSQHPALASTTFHTKTDGHTDTPSEITPESPAQEGTRPVEPRGIVWSSLPTTGRDRQTAMTGIPQKLLQECSSVETLRAVVQRNQSLTFRLQCRHYRDWRRGVRKPVPTGYTSMHLSSAVIRCPKPFCDSPRNHVSQAAQALAKCHAKKPALHGTRSLEGQVKDGDCLFEYLGSDPGCLTETKQVPKQGTVNKKRQGS